MARGTWVRGGVFSDTTGRRGMAFLRTRWVGGGTAFLRHSLRWKHGRWARVFPGVFPQRHAGRGSQCGGRRQAMGGVASARGAGTGRWRGGEVFSIRFAGVDARLVMRKGRPTRLRRGVFASVRRAGTGRCRQVASGAAAFFRVDEDRRSDRGVFPRRHAGRGVSAEGVVGRWAALSLRGCAGTGRWRCGEVFSIRFAGGRHPACDAEGAPTRLRRGVFASARRAGTARQAMSGDGAGSAEEVAAGGAVGVPCG